MMTDYFKKFIAYSPSKPFNKTLRKQMPINSLNSFFVSAFLMMNAFAYIILLTIILVRIVFRISNVSGCIFDTTMFPRLRGVLKEKVFIFVDIHYTQDVIIHGLQIQILNKKDKFFALLVGMELSRLRY